jgi:hypothetical protein
MILARELKCLYYICIYVRTYVHIIYTGWKDVCTTSTFRKQEPTLGSTWPSSLMEWTRRKQACLFFQGRARLFRLVLFCLNIRILYYIHTYVHNTKHYGQLIIIKMIGTLAFEDTHHWSVGTHRCPLWEKSLHFHWCSGVATWLEFDDKHTGCSAIFMAWSTPKYSLFTNGQLLARE